uniref:(+)RNA virus helicase C-terminal domain-containing protein n=1 Tax=Rhizoctonia solani putative virus 4 TaxID=2600096 RepID=A0A5B8HBG2_9VIRU|nr:hypothetical protein [Rhizoctonia solani putative virus 4]
MKPSELSIPLIGGSSIPITNAGPRAGVGFPYIPQTGSKNKAPLGWRTVTRKMYKGEVLQVRTAQLDSWKTSINLMEENQREHMRKARLNKFKLIVNKVIHMNRIIKQRERNREKYLEHSLKQAMIRQHFSQSRNSQTFNECLFVENCVILNINERLKRRFSTYDKFSWVYDQVENHGYVNLEYLSKPIRVALIGRLYQNRMCSCSVKLRDKLSEIELIIKENFPSNQWTLVAQKVADSFTINYEEACPCPWGNRCIYKDAACMEKPGWKQKGRQHVKQWRPDVYDQWIKTKLNLERIKSNSRNKENVTRDKLDEFTDLLNIVKSVAGKRTQANSSDWVVVRGGQRATRVVSAQPLTVAQKNRYLLLKTITDKEFLRAAKHEQGVAPATKQRNEIHSFESVHKLDLSNPVHRLERKLLTLNVRQPVVYNTRWIYEPYTIRIPYGTAIRSYGGGGHYFLVKGEMNGWTHGVGKNKDGWSTYTFTPKKDVTRFKILGRNSLEKQTSRARGFFLGDQSIDSFFYNMPEYPVVEGCSAVIVSKVPVDDIVLMNEREIRFYNVKKDGDKLMLSNYVKTEPIKQIELASDLNDLVGRSAGDAVTKMKLRTSAVVHHKTSGELSLLVIMTQLINDMILEAIKQPKMLEILISDIYRQAPPFICSHKAKNQYCYECTMSLLTEPLEEMSVWASMIATAVRKIIVANDLQITIDLGFGIKPINDGRKIVDIDSFLTSAFRRPVMENTYINNPDFFRGTWTFEFRLHNNYYTNNVKCVNKPSRGLFSWYNSFDADPKFVLDLLNFSLNDASSTDIHFLHFKTRANTMNDMTRMNLIRIGAHLVKPYPKNFNIMYKPGTKTTTKSGDLVMNVCVHGYAITNCIVDADGVIQNDYSCCENNVLFLSRHSLHSYFYEVMVALRKPTEVFIDETRLGVGGYGKTYSIAQEFTADDIFICKVRPVISDFLNYLKILNRNIDEPKAVTYEQFVKSTTTYEHYNTVYIDEITLLYPHELSAILCMMSYNKLVVAGDTSQIGATLRLQCPGYYPVANATILSKEVKYFRTTRRYGEGIAKPLRTLLGYEVYGNPSIKSTMKVTNNVDLLRVDLYKAILTFNHADRIAAELLNVNDSFVDVVEKAQGKTFDSLIVYVNVIDQSIINDVSYWIVALTRAVHNVVVVIRGLPDRFCNLEWLSAFILFLDMKRRLPITLSYKWATTIDDKENGFVQDVLSYYAKTINEIMTGVQLSANIIKAVMSPVNALVGTTIGTTGLLIKMLSGHIDSMDMSIEISEKPYVAPKVPIHFKIQQNFDKLPTSVVAWLSKTTGIGISQHHGITKQRTIVNEPSQDYVSSQVDINLSDLLNSVVLTKEGVLFDTIQITQSSSITSTKLTKSEKIYLSNMTRLHFSIFERLSQHVLGYNILEPQTHDVYKSKLKAKTHMAEFYYQKKMASAFGSISPFTYDDLMANGFWAFNFDEVCHSFQVNKTAATTSAVIKLISNPIGNAWNSALTIHSLHFKKNSTIMIGRSLVHRPIQLLEHTRKTSNVLIIYNTTQPSITTKWSPIKYDEKAKQVELYKSLSTAVFEDWSVNIFMFKRDAESSHSWFDTWTTIKYDVTEGFDITFKQHYTFWIPTHRTEYKHQRFNHSWTGTVPISKLNKIRNRARNHKVKFEITSESGHGKDLINYKHLIDQSYDLEVIKQIDEFCEVEQINIPNITKLVQSHPVAKQDDFNKVKTIKASYNEIMLNSDYKNYDRSITYLIRFEVLYVNAVQNDVVNEVLNNFETQTKIVFLSITTKQDVTATNSFIYELVVGNIEQDIFKVCHRLNWTLIDVETAIISKFTVLSSGETTAIEPTNFKSKSLEELEIVKDELALRTKLNNDYNQSKFVVFMECSIKQTLLNETSVNHIGENENNNTNTGNLANRNVEFTKEIEDLQLITVENRISAQTQITALMYCRNLRTIREAFDFEFYDVLDTIQNQLLSRAFKMFEHKRLLDFQNIKLTNKPHIIKQINHILIKYRFTKSECIRNIDHNCQFNVRFATNKVKLCKLWKGHREQNKVKKILNYSSQSYEVVQLITKKYNEFNVVDFSKVVQPANAESDLQKREVLKYVHHLGYDPSGCYEEWKGIFMKYNRNLKGYGPNGCYDEWKVNFMKYNKILNTNFRENFNITKADERRDLVKFKNRVYNNELQHLHKPLLINVLKDVQSVDVATKTKYTFESVKSMIEKHKTLTLNLMTLEWSSQYANFYQYSVVKLKILLENKVIHQVMSPNMQKYVIGTPADNHKYKFNMNVNKAAAILVNLPIDIWKDNTEYINSVPYGFESYHTYVAVDLLIKSKSSDLRIENSKAQSRALIMDTNESDESDKGPSDKEGSEEEEAFDDKVERIKNLLEMGKKLEPEDNKFRNSFKHLFIISEPKQSKSAKSKPKKKKK